MVQGLYAKVLDDLPTISGNGSESQTLRTSISTAISANPQPAELIAVKVTKSGRLHENKINRTKLLIRG